MCSSGPRTGVGRLLYFSPSQRRRSTSTVKTLDGARPHSGLLHGFYEKPILSLSMGPSCRQHGRRPQSCLLGALSSETIAGSCESLSDAQAPISNFHRRGHMNLDSQQPPLSAMNLAALATSIRTEAAASASSGSPSAPRTSSSAVVKQLKSFFDHAATNSNALANSEVALGMTKYIAKYRRTCSRMVMAAVRAQHARGHMQCHRSSSNRMRMVRA